MASRSQASQKPMPQTSFTYGELTPDVYGRLDFEGYYKGLQVCRNFIVSKYGGVDNRPGTEFIDFVHDSTIRNRLIPFKFNNQQQYILELGGQTMRIIENGVVVTGNPICPVTNVTPALSPSYVQLTVPSHPFANGNNVTVANVASGVNGAWTITVIDVNTISLTSCAVTNLAWVSGGTVTLTAPSTAPIVVVTPWGVADLQSLEFTQSADVITVTHNSYPVSDIKRYSDTFWVIAPFENTNGPFLDINVDESITILVSASVGNGITVTSSKPLFTADMVGELFYIKGSPDFSTPSWLTGTAQTIGDVVIWQTNYYKAETTTTTGNIGPTITLGVEQDGNPGVRWRYLHSGFGIVRITGYTNAMSVTANVVSYVPDSLVGVYGGGASKNVSNAFPATYNFANPEWPVLISPAGIVTSTPHGYTTGQQIVVQNVAGITGVNGTWTIDVIDTTSFYLRGCIATGTYTGGGTTNTSITAGTPSYLWAKSAWGVSQGYPCANAYYQNRKLFGGSLGQPASFWMSRSGGKLDFGQGDPILDDDAINYNLQSNEVNAILFFLELTYLIIFTTGSIWMVQGGTSSASGAGVITPSNINLQIQGQNAIGNVPPLRINNYALFIQSKGNQVKTLGYSFTENAFIGQDVTVMSKHLLTFNTIEEWGYQEIPYTCVWSVRDDGILLGFTFTPEQQITAWHRHDTQGAFESVCCIEEDGQDVVYFIVNRTLNGVTKRCIERMGQRAFQTPSDAFFVDCGLTYDGRGTGTKATTISGLDHLNGMTVAICADGAVVPPQVVSSGTIHLTVPALVVHVGLSYTADIKTLDLSNEQVEVRDKAMNINAISLILKDTGAFLIGPDEDTLLPYSERTVTGGGATNDLINGLVDINITADWSKDKTIFIRQSDPLPISVLAIIPQVLVGKH